MKRGTVLITGASSGIGEAFARKFAEEGFDLVLTARRADRLEALMDELGSVNVQVYPTDLAIDENVDSLCEFIETEQIDVDLLVNNAAMMIEQPFEEMTESQVLQTIALNMTAATRLTHRFLPGMMQRRGGRILNVASIAAFHPIPGMDLYAATKSFILSLTESLSENLKGTGVSVTALCPGITDTGMMDLRIAGALPPFAISSPEEVAREGYDALMQRDVIRIPGQANKLAVTVAQLQPRWLVRALGGLASRLNR